MVEPKDICQKGRKVEIATLYNEGWKNVGSHGNSIILALGKRRILYNLKKKQVTFEYENVNPILGC